MATTNEMIFRTLKTKVFNYKGERNPEPKYAQALRDMGYTVDYDTNADAYDEDARWRVNGREIYSCMGKNTSFSTANGYVDGMANIGKIDFENLFRVWDERKAKLAEMNKRGKIYDERYYRKDWNKRRYMTQFSGNTTIERYKNLCDRVDRNCSWERRDLVRAEKQLEEAMKNLERAKARLAKAEASNEEDLAKIDEILKAAGVRH